MKNTKAIEEQIEHTQLLVDKNLATIGEHERAIMRYKRHITRQRDSIVELQDKLKTRIIERGGYEYLEDELDVLLGIKTSK